LAQEPAARGGVVVTAFRCPPGTSSHGDDPSHLTSGVGHLTVVAPDQVNALHRAKPTRAVPMDDSLLRHGVQVALAIKLFQEGTVSLGKTAKLAGLDRETFIDRLSSLGIPAVDYPAEDLCRPLTIGGPRSCPGSTGCRSHGYGCAGPSAP